MTDLAGLSIATLIGVLIFGYLLGSIPFGLVITRVAGMGDIRAIGSGNIGATNVLRTGNKMLAALTLLGDAGKGAAAVLIARALGPEAAGIAGLGAFLGHLFPVWLGFKGGKGVATYLGVLAGLAWQAALVFAAVWLVVAFLLRYSSLAALTAAVVVPVALYLMGAVDLAVLFLVLTAILFFTHRTNISRLAGGTESKIGAKG